ncbi:hypothetical protein D3C76_575390 [compost metagenome]
MSGHNHLRPVPNRGAEWLQFNRIESFAIMCQNWHSQMGVYRCITMPRKMFNCCDDPGLMQAFYCCHPKPGYQVRIRAKRTHPDNRIVRIAVNIEHRGKIHLQPERLQLFPCQPACRFGQRRVTGCAKRHLAGKIRAAGDSLNNASFLIYAEKQWDVACFHLQIMGECCKLPRVYNIFVKQN